LNYKNLLHSIEDANMKVLKVFILISIMATVSFAQGRAYEVHSRSMLNETIYNTGEIGRAMDGGQNGIPNGVPPSMEWPPNSHMILDRVEYAGQHNSLGGGVWMAATRNGKRVFSFCGGLTTSSAQSRQIVDVYSKPISLTRTENYPLLADGSINGAYNPDEAEEIIVSKWNTADTNFQVTRTSRAWSYPCYNNFIIFEYEFTNITSDTLNDVFFSFTNALAPSAFGYTRKFNRWYEKDFRNNEFARLDIKRYMSYNHDWNGKPDTVDALFNTWSQQGDRGGLNSPQAAGVMVLHYDYDHLTTKDVTSLTVSTDDAKWVWDSNNKMKQPYLMRYENGNCDESKVQAWIDLAARKTGPVKSSDSTVYGSYWLGRVKPNFKNGWTQPVVHGYGYGPYRLAPGQTAKFAVAEVVGYGPGVAGDSIYSDIGGSTNTGETNDMHPITSWYKALSYSDVTSPIGSNYLQTHPLPWYVDSRAVSIRDNADRCIQLYTGTPLLKHDGPINDLTTQFEPQTTPDHGVYNTPLVKIPFPAPVISVVNTPIGKNNIVWNNKLESFTTAKLSGALSYYLVYRATSPLGQYTLIDSVGIADTRYYTSGQYVVPDAASVLGTSVSYFVVSVDANGNRSGITNITTHVTQRGAVKELGKVYVVPNPLVVTNGQTGSVSNGEITDQIGFCGLTKNCTIKIYSFSGQLVETLKHNEDAYMNVAWFQISRNVQLVASGVYFFTVQDNETGKVAKGKFVIIH
jgi:hypothetical protein